MQTENDKPADDIVEEGEKVTGGEEATKNQESNATQGTAGSTSDKDEVTPQHDTKKEDMTSYNEHPDQEKVGGG